jgi:uncharacterized protein YndB with AHSA1/START domain
MLPVILIVIAAVVVTLLVVVAMQPEGFRIARSATIAAAPAEVFPQVNDFHRWDQWSPWAKIDPAMKTTYEGPATGEGSSYSWSGNNKVGAGKMTVLKCQPPQRILIQLEFLRPMKVTNTAEFTFEPKDRSTVVTWAMTGKKNFMAKAFHLVVNMDKMLGGEFDKGLAQLKAVVESPKK